MCGASRSYQPHGAGVLVPHSLDEVFGVEAAELVRGCT
jgi:hypothetical protein